MGKPIIKSGKLTTGAHVQCGENVVVEVAEEVVVGDRCVIPDNAHFGGRRVTIGNDWFGYSWQWQRLDIGRGRIDEEDAVFTMGSRCTTHANKVDLVRRVTIGDDVGLSPEVAIFGHFYWMSSLDGFPMRYGKVDIGRGTIVGYRSVVLPDAVIHEDVVVGAQSVVSGILLPRKVYAGNPARVVSEVLEVAEHRQVEMLKGIVDGWLRSCAYRFKAQPHVQVDFPLVRVAGASFDVERRTLLGDEGPLTDDFRWWLFRHGIKIYTKRPFTKMPYNPPFFPQEGGVP